MAEAQRQSWAIRVAPFWATNFLVRQLSTAAGAYRVVLFDGGHLCQTFCLVATWLGLAPFCTAALKDTLIDDYVVQEAVDLSPGHFPIFNQTEWNLQPMFVDTNPFLFVGKVCGAMVRLSDSPVVNVTSGGGETGFLL